MEPILNRWRGTGDIFNVYKFRVTGTMIYAIYLALLFGLVTGSVIIGVVTLIGFLAGESFGFGKWVGTLVTDEPKDLEVEYLDKEGYGFPYIHYMASIKKPGIVFWDMNEPVQYGYDYQGIAHYNTALPGGVYINKPLATAAIKHLQATTTL